jgi:hypothetical protein
MAHFCGDTARRSRDSLGTGRYFEAIAAPLLGRCRKDRRCRINSVAGERQSGIGGRIRFLERSARLVLFLKTGSGSLVGERFGNKRSGPLFALRPVNRRANTKGKLLKMLG